MAHEPKNDGLVFWGGVGWTDSGKQQSDLTWCNPIFPILLTRALLPQENNSISLFGVLHSIIRDTIQIPAGKTIFITWSLIAFPTSCSLFNCNIYRGCVWGLAALGRKAIPLSSVLLNAQQQPMTAAAAAATVFPADGTLCNNRIKRGMKISYIQESCRSNHTHTHRQG